MSRVPKWIWFLIALGGFILLILSGLFYLFKPRAYRYRETALKPGSYGEINILIIGKDARALNPEQDRGGETRIPREKVAHSDIVIIAHINLNFNRVTLLALPRDLLVMVPGVTTATSNTDFTQMEKLTHTYTIGGEALLRRTAEQLLRVKIQRFVAFDFDTFRMIFNLLRSVLGPIKVGSRSLADPTQALKFARQRNGLPYDDLDRCRNNLNLIYTVLTRIWRFTQTRLGDMLIDRAFKIIGEDTDLTPEEVKQIIGALKSKKFNPANTRLAVLVSEGKPVTLKRYMMTLSCYLPIYSEIEKQIQHYLYDRDDIPALSFMTQEAYSSPWYLGLNYELIPPPPNEFSARQELIKKILDLQKTPADSLR